MYKKWMRTAFLAVTLLLTLTLLSACLEIIPEGTETPPVTEPPPVTDIPAVYGVAMPLEAPKMTIGLTIGEDVLIQLPAAGGMPPYSWTLWGSGSPSPDAVSGLPNGLSLESSGYLKGTLLVTEPATYHFAVMLQDSANSSVVTEYYLVVKDLSKQVPGGEGGPTMGGKWVATTYGFEFKAARATGQHYSFSQDWEDFTSDQYLYAVPFVHSGTRPWTFIVSGLPDGLTYDPSTGIIQGPLSKAPSGRTIEVRSYLKDAAGRVANPEGGTIFTFRVDYSRPAPWKPDPATGKGTLSASGGAGNTLSLSGYGVIGTGSAVVTVPAGSYILTVTSPTGAVLYQGRVRIDAGKVTTARISPY